MTEKRIVIIGAASRFGPGLVTDLVKYSEHFGGGTIALVDIDAERLEVIAEFARRAAQAAGAPFKVESSTDWRTALPGADSVIVTIAVGVFEAQRFDITIPMKYGCYYHIADTVGPGAVFRAFRHIPAIVDIARTMEEVCPDAWLFNYSNPLSCICRAVTRTTKVKTLGLCPGYLGMPRIIGDILGVDEDEIEILPAGINHCTWIKELRVRGEDGYSMLREKAEDPSLLDEERDGIGMALKLYRTFGLFPSPGAGHVAEFYPFFRKDVPDAVKEGKEELIPDKRTRDRREFWEKLSEALKQGGMPSLEALGLARPVKIDVKEEPGARQRGTKGWGTMAVGIAATLATKRKEMYVVNIPNKGHIANLPQDAVVEVPGIIGPSEVHGLCMGALPESVAGTIRTHITQQELIVDAALSGDRRIALQALLADPCITYSLEEAKSLLDEMLKLEAEWLPQFA